jgi:alkanesulfonate monooxygenase SsuD/methylene tetrahydromethanopterin reductase-like flavin-dependent oxidoreductase (luciferase family)
VRVNLMIEGQESVTWPQWVGLAEAAEAAGLEGLFRSDHYQSVASRTERSALDAWVTIGGLGVVTERLRLGTMVSPASFRHPSILAKNAVTADHICGGRVELGMGAGWHELEHRTYGFDFHDLGTRYDVFEEQVEIVTRQFREERFDHHGVHYRLEDCRANPKPVQTPGIPVILGGNAGPRSARLAARFADEYNTVFPTLDAVVERKSNLAAACEAVGREPLPLSIMTGCLLGRDEAEVHERASRLHERSGADVAFEAWLDGLRPAWVIGTVEQAAERLAAFTDAGVSRFMLQHLLHDDLDMVPLLGQLAAA